MKMLLQFSKKYGESCSVSTTTSHGVCSYGIFEIESGI